MAYFLFTNDSDTGNMDLPWHTSDEHASDLGPSDTVPSAGDTAWLAENPDSGTCEGNVSPAGAITINGGTFNGSVDDHVVDAGDGFLDINFGVFNQGVTLDFSTNSVINDGEFHSTVSVGVIIYGGFFYGEIHLLYSGASIEGLSGSHGDIYVSAGASIDVDSGNFTARLTFDNGASWFYSPQSTYVAPADKVLVGTSNLDVAGTASAGGGGGGSPVIQPGIRP